MGISQERLGYDVEQTAPKTQCGLTQQILLVYSLPMLQVQSRVVVVVVVVVGVSLFYTVIQRPHSLYLCDLKHMAVIHWFPVYRKGILRGFHAVN